MNIHPTLSNAGTWTPVTDNSVLSKNFTGSLANTFHSLININGSYGLVVSGWAFSGWPPTLSATAPVNVALLTNSNGALFVNTSQYISNPQTNGAGSAIVADFNNDGQQDIVLLAHNESPFVPMPSTAWMSNGVGGFSKIQINDQVMAHDAELVTINGRPAILSTTFTQDDHGNVMKGALNSPIYTYTNNGFSVVEPAGFKAISGMDSTIVSNGTNSGQVLVRGDVFDNNGGQSICIYSFSNNDVASSTPTQTIVPYLSTLPQFKNFPADIGGAGATHTYRLWAEDLNNDGKEDILAGESMWSQSNRNFPSMLQILINKGDGTFADATNKLNPDMGLYTSEMDYNPNFVDIDHSGIKTYLFAGSTSWGSMTRQSDYVLLNDGTGRLYIALHDQFMSLARDVLDYLKIWYDSGSTPPRFIGIPQSDGSINFVAEVSTKVYNSTALINQDAYQFVNVPLNYNPSKDFQQNLIISDRNNSKLMRTWAGNDSFTDVNANSAPAHIDGGLGIDTSTYSQASSSYHITHNIDGTESIVGNGISDTLVNIERLKFIDKSFAMDISGNAGTTAKILGAVFGKTAITNKQYVGIGLDLLDKGMSYDTLAGLALSAAKATSNDQIVTTLWTNVVGSAPSAADKAPFIKMLEDGMTPGALAHMAADTSYNTANINLVGLMQTGLEFLPFSG